MVEFIGFLISLVAILFLFFKNGYDARQRRKYPPYDLQEEDLHEDDPIREMLRVMEAQRAAEETPPKAKAPPPRDNRAAAPIQKKTPLAEYKLRSELEEHRIQSGIESRRLASKLEQRKVQPTMGTYEAIQGHVEPPARAKVVVEEFGSLRQMILAHEILSPPKAFRKSPDNFN